MICFFAVECGLILVISPMSTCPGISRISELGSRIAKNLLDCCRMGTLSRGTAPGNPLPACRPPTSTTTAPTEGLCARNLGALQQRQTQMQSRSCKKPMVLTTRCSSTATLSISVIVATMIKFVGLCNLVVNGSNIFWHVYALNLSQGRERGFRCTNFLGFETGANQMITHAGCGSEVEGDCAECWQYPLHHTAIPRRQLTRFPRTVWFLF